MQGQVVTSTIVLFQLVKNVTQTKYIYSYQGAVVEPACRQAGMLELYLRRKMIRVFIFRTFTRAPKQQYKQSLPCKIRHNSYKNK